MAKQAVRSQMPKMTAKTSGSCREMSGPFDRARSGANGGSNIPTHTMESMGETTQRTVSASFASAPQSGAAQHRGRYPLGGKK